MMDHKYYTHTSVVQLWRANAARRRQLPPAARVPFAITALNVQNEIFAQDRENQVDCPNCEYPSAGTPAELIFNDLMRRWRLHGRLIASR